MKKLSKKQWEEIEEFEDELRENPEFRKAVRKLFRETGLSGFDEDEDN